MSTTARIRYDQEQDAAATFVAITDLINHLITFTGELVSIEIAEYETALPSRAKFPYRHAAGRLNGIQYSDADSGFSAHLTVYFEGRRDTITLHPQALDYVIVTVWVPVEPEGA